MKETNRPNAALCHFLESLHCSQAILETYGPELGLPADTARRLATGFAGGMGLGTECGAVTAALMVVGLKLGDDVGEVQPVVERFIEQFRQQNGSIDCSELTGFDMGSKEGQQYAMANKDQFLKRCSRCVRSAGVILDELLDTSD